MWNEDTCCAAIDVGFYFAGSNRIFSQSTSLPTSACYKVWGTVFGQGKFYWVIIY